MNPQDLQIREKNALEGQGETTNAGRYYASQTDIHETNEALVLMMDMPGVPKSNVDIHLEKNVLTVTGKIDSSKNETFKPIYTEYQIGNYTRSFTLSNEINREEISATMTAGTLTLNLPKMQAALSQKIQVQ